MGPSADRRTPLRTPLRQRWAAVLAGLLAASMLLGACSGDDGSPSAEDSAGQVLGTFELGEGDRACLEREFDDDASAREAMAAEDPGGPDVAAVGTVLDECLPATELPRAVARSISRSLPPVDPAATDQQTGCLEQTLLGFAPGDRAALYLGLLRLDVDPTSDLADTRSELVNALFEACAVTAAGDPTGDSGG